MLEALETVACLLVVAVCGWILVVNHRMIVTKGMTAAEIEAWRTKSSSAATSSWREIGGKLLSGLGALAIGAALCGILFPTLMIENGAVEGIQFRSVVILSFAVPCLALGSKLAPRKSNPRRS